MGDIARIFDIITIVISVTFFIKNLHKLGNGSRQIIYFIFFFFYVVPLFLDYIIGFSEYEGSAAMFSVGQFDEYTRIVYDIIICFSQYVLINFKKNTFVSDNIQVDIPQRLFNTVVILGMILPTLLAFVFSVPKYILFTPMWRENGFLQFAAENPHYYTLEKLDFVAVCCSVLLMLYNKKWTYKVLGALFLFVGICVEGKRSIIFFALLVFMMNFAPGLSRFTKNNKSSYFLLISGVFAICYFVIFFSIQVLGERLGGVWDTTQQYTHLRIDIFRDDRMRLVIYSLLHPENLKILDYPFQTIFPLITTFWPIDIIFAFFFHYHYLSFSKFFTAALLGTAIEQRATLMTPDIYSELIANMGVFGIIIFPFLLIWFSKIIDRVNSPVNSILSIMIVCLIMYSSSYVSFFIEFALIIYLLYRKRGRVIN